MPSIKRCTSIVGSVATFTDVVMTGSTGPPGQGVPIGGTANQVLSKIDATNYNTQWVTPGTATVADGSITNIKLATMPTLTMKGNATGATAAPTDLTAASVKTLLALTKTDVGLGNVDNTSDVNAPVSTAQATAIGLKADKTISIGVTAPITGGGDLSANRTIGISTFAGSAIGAVPLSVGGTVNFLRADGTWAAPPGGLSQATADGLYLNVTGPDSMTGLLTLTTNATGKALQVNNSTDRGIDILANNAGLRVMRAVSNTPYIEFYDNTGATNYGFIQFGATTWTIGKGSTVGLTGTTTNVTANIQLLLSTSLPATALEAASKGYVDTQDAFSPLKTTTISTTAPLTGGGDLSANRTLDISTFTSTVKGAVPPPTTVTSTKYLRDDGTWVVPPDTTGITQATADTLYSPLRQVIPAAQGTGVTSYTIALADENKLNEFTAPTAIAISVPTNATLPVPIGYRTDFFQTGAGKITVAAVTPGTTTIIASPSAILRAVGSAASLTKVGTDRWLLAGDLT